MVLCFLVYRFWPAKNDAQGVNDTSYAVAASSWYLPAVIALVLPHFSVVRFRARSAKTNNDRKTSTA
jgi:hypothetical protein